MSAAEREAPLAGLRVLEVGALIAGPFAARLLAEFGADVIKVEEPGRPDPLRTWGAAEYKGRPLFWPVQGRGKRCVTLNLREARGRELFLELVERSDVVVENLRPGNMERLDLGYERLAEANPGIILARVSGYGQTGPEAHRPGFASVAEARSGMRHLNGFPGGPPPRVGLSLGDSLASLFALQGILIALHWRETRGDGVGQEIDVALTESCFAMLESIVPEYDLLGLVRQPSGTGLEGIVPSNLYPTSDGRWIVVAANTDSLFRRFAAAIGRPGLADDTRFAGHRARAENQDELERLISDWTGARTAEEVEAVLDAEGVPSARVATIADVFADRQFAARQMLVRMSDEQLGEFAAPGIVPKLSRTPGSPRWAGRAEPGSDNEDVFAGLLGHTDVELGELHEEGVV